MIESITFEGLFRFFFQFFLALTGATALWASVFSWKAPSLLRIITISFAVSYVAFLVMWWAGYMFVFPMEAFAHEGFRILPNGSEVVHGFQASFPFVVVSMIVALLGLLGLSFERSMKYSTTFFLLQFLLLSGVSFLAVLEDGTWKEQFFQFLHSWHSFFTLGTVVVVDLLFLAAQLNVSLKRAIYGIFPLMSAVIWVGLGLDFASVLLVFEQVFHVTSQTMFSQVAVAVIILNGAFLSGRVTDILIASVREVDPVKLSKRTMTVMNLAGAISITSWISITFVDFFEFTVSFWYLFSVYLLVIVLAYLAHEAADKVMHKH